MYCSIYSGIVLLILVHGVVPENLQRSNIFNYDLYDDVLNPHLCKEHLDYIVNDSQLRMNFLDAGIRTPIGILQGNLAHMGNYHQCLRIKHEMDYSEDLIEGKYCTIKVPLVQPRFVMPDLDSIDIGNDFAWLDFLWNGTNSTLQIDENLYDLIIQFNNIKNGINAVLGFPQKLTSSMTQEPEFQFAICIPKSCTTKEALNILLFNVSDTGLNFTEESCRLPNDKPFVAADYITIFIIVVIGILTVSSTSFDLFRQYFYRNDSKEDRRHRLTMFSLYSNAKTLVCSKVKNPYLGHIAGVKAILIMWTIVSHTFVTHFTGIQANPLETLSWLTSLEAVWITSYHYSVDILMMISGILVVYNLLPYVSTRKQMFRRIPRLYLHRFRRVLPVIAIVVLLQASVLNHILDGPNWDPVVTNTQNCRRNWWLTILQIQINARPMEMCLSHSWFFGLDNQSYLQTPLILLPFVGSKVEKHKIFLTLSILIGLIISIVANFVQNTPSSLFATSRPQDLGNYFTSYYINAMTRGGPFMVGTEFGYFFVKFQKNPPKISKVIAALLWITSAATSIFLIWLNYPIVQTDWNNQIADNFINIFARYLWCASMGWILIACSLGCGGIVNWFLSHKMWKMLGRLSMAMYVVHYPIIHVINSTALTPIYFSTEDAVRKAITNYVISALAAFVIMLLVERPCSALVKSFDAEKEIRSETLESPDSVLKVQMEDETDAVSAIPEKITINASI